MKTFLFFIWMLMLPLSLILLFVLLISLIVFIVAKMKKESNEGKNTRLKFFKKIIIISSVSAVVSAACFFVPLYVATKDINVNLETTAKLTEEETVTIRFYYTGFDGEYTFTVFSKNKLYKSIGEDELSSVNQSLITDIKDRKDNSWKKVLLLREEEDGTKVYSLLWNEYRLYLYPSGEMKVKPATQETANK